ncbi:MAG TPA: hypothetical protein VF132_13750 [Rudaea sp.]
MAGQLGNGTKIDSPSPVEVVAPKLGGGYHRIERVKHIATGGTHSCAVVAETQTYAVCWGRNDSGQLGTGNHIDSVAATPVFVTPLHGMPYVLTDVDRLAGGSFHTCAILEATRLAECWGSNVSGQIGNPAAGMMTSSPFGIPASFAQLSGGDQHTCGIMTDGHLSCWGLNDDGQLGDGFNDTAHSPLILSISGTTVSAGVSHSCAVTPDATIRCWGKNNAGQLGTGNLKTSNWPVLVLRFNDRIFADDYEVRSDGL